MPGTLPRATEPIVESGEAEFWLSDIEPIRGRRCMGGPICGNEDILLATVAYSFEKAANRAHQVMVPIFANAVLIATRQS